MLQQDNTFRGLFSSPLAVFMAVLAFLPVVRKYAAASWHEFVRKKLPHRLPVQ